MKDYSIFFLKQGSVLVFIETGQAAFEEGGGGVVVYTAEEGAVPDCFEITSSDIAVAWAFVITNNYLLIQLKASWS